MTAAASEPEDPDIPDAPDAPDIPDAPDAPDALSEDDLPEGADRLVEPEYEGIPLLTGPVVEFEKSLRTGIKVMDGDHADLVRLVNRLAIIVERAPGSVQVRLGFEALNRYAIEHFRREEQLLRRYRYPGYPAHREEHLIFRRFCLATRRVMLDSPSFVDPNRLVNFLKNWLVKHFRGSDRLYADFISKMSEGRRAGDLPSAGTELVEMTIRVPKRFESSARAIERILTGPHAKAVELEVSVDAFRAASALDFTIEEAREMVAMLKREP